MGRIVSNLQERKFGGIRKGRWRKIKGREVTGGGCGIWEQGVGRNILSNVIKKVSWSKDKDC